LTENVSGQEKKTLNKPLFSPQFWNFWFFKIIVHY